MEWGEQPVDWRHVGRCSGPATSWSTGKVCVCVSHLCHCECRHAAPCYSNSPPQSLSPSCTRRLSHLFISELLHVTATSPPQSLLPSSTRRLAPALIACLLLTHL